MDPRLTGCEPFTPSAGPMTTRCWVTTSPRDSHVHGALHVRAQPTPTPGFEASRRRRQYRSEVSQQHRDPLSSRAGCRPCLLSHQYGCGCGKFGTKRRQVQILSPRPLSPQATGRFLRFVTCGTPLAIPPKSADRHACCIGPRSHRPGGRGDDPRQPVRFRAAIEPGPTHSHADDSEFFLRQAD